MNIEPEISEPKCTQDSAMESEMSFFLQEAAETCCESRTIFQAQAMEGQNKLGDNFCSSSGKKRRLKLNQVKLLERNFIAGNKLEHDKKVQIAKEIGLQPRQVAVWFQNRRARSKTKKMENDYDSLNNDYDKLKKDFDNLLEENQRLKAEVDELRGKQIAIEKMKNNPSEPVEAMDSSVTEFGKTNTMGSCRQEEGSRSSSKSDAFYSESESPAMENQSQLAQAAALFQDEEDDIEKFCRLDDGSSVDELMDSYYNIITAVEDQPFFFWSQID